MGLNNQILCHLSRVSHTRQPPRAALSLRTRPQRLDPLLQCYGEVHRVFELFVSALKPPHRIFVHRYQQLHDFICSCWRRNGMPLDLIALSPSPGVGGAPRKRCSRPGRRLHAPTCRHGRDLKDATINFCAPIFRHEFRVHCSRRGAPGRANCRNCTVSEARRAELQPSRACGGSRLGCAGKACLGSPV